MGGGKAIYQESAARLAELLPLATIIIYNYCFENFKNTSNLCDPSIENELAASQVKRDLE